MSKRGVVSNPQRSVWGRLLLWIVAPSGMTRTNSSQTVSRKCSNPGRAGDSGRTAHGARFRDADFLPAPRAFQRIGRYTTKWTQPRCRKGSFRLLLLIGGKRYAAFLPPRRKRRPAGEAPTIRTGSGRVIPDLLNLPRPKHSAMRARITVL